MEQAPFDNSWESELAEVIILEFADLFPMRQPPRNKEGLHYAEIELSEKILDCKGTRRILWKAFLYLAFQ